MFSYYFIEHFYFETENIFHNFKIAILELIILDYVTAKSV